MPGTCHRESIVAVSCFRAPQPATLLQAIGFYAAEPTLHASGHSLCKGKSWSRSSVHWYSSAFHRHSFWRFQMGNTIQRVLLQLQMHLRSHSTLVNFRLEKHLIGLVPFEFQGKRSQFVHGSPAVGCDSSQKDWLHHTHLIILHNVLLFGGHSGQKYLMTETIDLDEYQNDYFPSLLQNLLFLRDLLRLVKVI